MLKISPQNSKYRSKPTKDYDIYQYFASRLGSSKHRTQLFLTVLEEFVCLKLATNQRAFIPQLGSIQQERKGLGKTIKFRISKSLLDKSLKAAEEPFCIAVNKIKQKLQDFYRPSEEEQVEELYSSLRISLDPRQCGVLKKRIRDNYFRFQFLKYLQLEFPSCKDWVHPVTKEIYKWRHTKNYLLALRESHPKNYAAIYTMWIGLTHRKGMLDKYNMDSETIWEQLYTAIDLIVGQLILNDLGQPAADTILNLDDNEQNLCTQQTQEMTRTSPKNEP